MHTLLKRNAKILCTYVIFLSNEKPQNPEIGANHCREPLHLVMGPLHGVIINWFAHKVGYTNHKLYDTSTNMFPIEILMLGEGLHNNHHAQGQNPNFAQKWWEFDPTYLVIQIFNLLGIVKLKK